MGHAATRRRLPFGLMPFLDDAHRLGLLRAVGPEYQFRHAEFQDHLARWYRQTHPDAVASVPASDPQPRKGFWFIVSSLAAGVGLGCADTLVRTADTASNTDLEANGGGVLLGVLGAGHLLWTWRAARRPRPAPVRHPGAARRAPGLLQQQKNRRSKLLERGLDLRFFKLYSSTLSSPDGAHGRWMQDARLVIEALCSLDRSVV
ncbi:hypothetical protein ACFY1L_52135 [Streptomyces sp. NPDC001663]|uniref:hypothetical protein n=1 Tax=Streptomyces sp. NPDC001663 TaxID=3364597 RepID=UPI00368E8329